MRATGTQSSTTPSAPRRRELRAAPRLAFLVGHFRGDGVDPDRGASFQKEVLDSWEAGGRFIGLRMAATYPLDDGRNDVHQALVLVGYNDSAAAYEARAYTDSGTTRDDQLSVSDDRIVFNDRVPGHVHRTGARARKVLTRRSDGYLETLEIESESRPAQLCSSLELRRVANGARPGV